VGDYLETFAHAAQIPTRVLSCGKGTAKISPHLFEEKFFQIVQKRHNLHYETLTWATGADAERQLYGLAFTANDYMYILIF